MQRWWIAVVAVIGIGLAFLLFPRPDRGASVTTGERPSTAVLQTEENPFDPPTVAPEPEPAPAFGSRDKVRRPEPPQKVSPEVREAQLRLAELRSRPDAQASARLIGAWSGVRKTLLDSEVDEAADLAERLRQPLSDLVEFRRNPERAVPFDQTRATLDAIRDELKGSPFAGEGFIPDGLQRHAAITADFDAKVSGNGSEESP